MYANKLKEMFSCMVLNKDASVIPLYYHPDFMLYTNGEEMDYAVFLKEHQTYYETAIKYAIVYDEATFVEQGERLAGRVWITTQMPGQEARKIEVIFIAHYKEGKIYRLWELTYPDWSTLPEFN